MTDNPELAHAVGGFARGDLGRLSQIRQATRAELDEVARTSQSFELSKHDLTALLRSLPLDRDTQHKARIWAYFWSEGVFPQQVEGESIFDTEWEDDPSLAMAEVMDMLLWLGDDDVGWLDEAQREHLLQLLERREAGIE